MANVGQTVNLGNSISVGRAPGQSQFSSSTGQARIINERTINGVKFFDIDQTAVGGGTGWVRASDLETASSGRTQDTSARNAGPSQEPVKDFLAAFREAQQEVIREQTAFTKEFLANNPLAFDEELAKRGSTERFRPFYTQLLDDFTQDIEVKKRRSLEDETALLSELTRGREFAVGKETRSFERAREAAREGFAGAGLFFSGIAKTAVGEKEVESKAEVSDIIGRSEALGSEARRLGAETREEDLLPGELSSVQRKQRSLFGPEFGFDTPGAFQEAVLEDIEAKRRVAEEQRKQRALIAITEKFGGATQQTLNFLGTNPISSVFA